MRCTAGRSRRPCRGGERLLHCDLGRAGRRQGRVDAYEVEEVLVNRALENLENWPAYGSTHWQAEGGCSFRWFQAPRREASSSSPARARTGTRPGLSHLRGSCHVSARRMTRPTSASRRRFDAVTRDPYDPFGSLAIRIALRGSRVAPGGSPRPSLETASDRVRAKDPMHGRAAAGIRAYCGRR
jgi:hypothetical protein